MFRYYGETYRYELGIRRFRLDPFKGGFLVMVITLGDTMEQP